MERKKTSLQASMRKNIIGFALMLIVTLGALIGVQYWYSRLAAYTRTAYNYAKTAAGFIDGDRIKKYVETGKKDEHYYYVEKLLSTTLQKTDLKYYYVFVPYDNDLVYVWDGDGKYENDEPYDLGYREGYMSDESKAATMRVYQPNPPETLHLQKHSEYGYIGSAYYPVFDHNGQPVAVVGLDISMPRMQLSLRRYILLIVLGVTALTLAALYVYYRRVDKFVIQPIKEMERGAREMVGNLERDEKVEIDVQTGDELEDLAECIEEMGDDLRKYVNELAEVTAERERIGAELDVARSIQASVLPTTFPAYPDRSEFDLFATMIPAKQVGGDFYDFFLVDEDHIALVMADVSGKGIPAALFMMVSKLNIKNAMKSGLSPAKALELVNDQLLESNESGYFVTVWLAVVDLRTGEGVVANCGHEHPVLKHKDGEFEVIKYAHSPAVATLEGLEFKEHAIKLNAGDMLFVYTDGVAEASNDKDELFGEDRLLATLNANKNDSPAELLPHVKEGIDAFVCDAPQFDDITMLAFRYNGD